MRWAGSRRPAGRPGRAIAAVAAVGLSVVAGACGSDDSDGGSADRPSAEGADNAKVITIENFAFQPEPLTVAKGTVVRVVNRDDAPHTATADDDAFDTGELGQGDTAEITLSEPGEVAYHCDIHDYMRGVIRVGD